MSRARDNADLGDSFGVLGSGVTGGSGLTALGTVTAGNISHADIVYPTGHVIGQAVQQTQAGSNIGNNNSTYTDIGLELSYVTKRANTQSYLIIDFHTSMSYVQSTGTRQMDITMRTVSDTDYEVDEIISGTSGSYRALFLNTNSGESYTPFSFRLFCGTAGGGMRMPTTKSSWSAGDTLYFRLFSKSSTGNFYVVHNDGVATFTITEVLI